MFVLCPNDSSLGNHYRGLVVSNYNRFRYSNLGDDEDLENESTDLELDGVFADAYTGCGYVVVRYGPPRQPASLPAAMEVEEQVEQVEQVEPKQREVASSVVMDGQLNVAPCGTHRLDPAAAARGNKLQGGWWQEWCAMLDARSSLERGQAMAKSIYETIEATAGACVGALRAARERIPGPAALLARMELAGLGQRAGFCTADHERPGDLADQTGVVFTMGPSNDHIRAANAAGTSLCKSFGVLYSMLYCVRHCSGSNWVTPLELVGSAHLLARRPGRHGAQVLPRRVLDKEAQGRHDRARGAVLSQQRERRRRRRWRR